ncbi:MAG TPA: FecR family protein [Candidatus Desulfobacillus denitrificans]|nr:FecR family protein [Candidatus Desulfobacillus denitrificans]HNT61558.1 FecR family protein [Candidatus Desulfobacillus denitrificans]
MPNEFKLKSSVALMAALSAAFPLAGHAANAARVDFAAGDVKALSPDGRSRPLAKGAEIASGETIDTGSGRAQVRFTDGAQVSLAPQTQFRIDDYRFSGQADGSEKGFFSLLKGGLRTITGLVGRTNRENYRVTTTVATIGIRGTEFSVIYGNSINVTTGEGSNEVCNAAGCLILNSGETAYVPDANTRPVMSDKKAEIPPPPVQEGQLPGFVAGNNTTSDGTPAGLSPGLVSGPGFSIAGVGVIDGSSELDLYDGNFLSTYATFSGNSLTKFTATDTEIYEYVQGTAVGMLTDGILGWGRWIDGTYVDGLEGGTSMQHVHYVVGRPTPLSDMNALQLGNVTASYTLSGYTYPTAWDSYTSTFTFGTQPISGSLTANFGAGTVDGSLSVPMGVNTYSTSWSGSIIAGASFGGYGSVSSTGSDCGCACGASVAGFFAGANAARAGLGYEISGTVYGDIHGAAVFSKSGSGGGGGGGGGI